MKAATDAWIALEDEEDEEEEGGDDDAMHALFDEEQHEKETYVESDGKDLDEIFGVFLTQWSYPLQRQKNLICQNRQNWILDM